MPSLRAIAAATFALTPIPAFGQDPFEIQVYEYRTVPRGKWNLETHFNHVHRGTTVFDGPVAPTEGQTHLTFELTRGITDHVELAGYLVTARREGESPEYVAWRVRPRVRVPRSWNWPVGVSLSAEVAFPRQLFDEARTTLEVRPIIERVFGPVQVDLNPVIGRALRGRGVGDGWDFEPGVRIGYNTSQRLTLSLEYYAATGPVDDPLPAREQVHLFFPGGDLRFGTNVVLNLGVGFGATTAGNRLVSKMRLGVMW